jgi:hypothetical protein
MAWGSSAVFAYTMLQLATAKTINLSTDALYVPLWTGASSQTPSNTVTTAATASYNGAGSQWVAATYEVAASGNYTTGGASIGAQTCTQASNVVKYTSSGTPSWTTVTWANVYGCSVYEYSGSAASVQLCYNYFGGDQSIVAGTSIQGVAA